MKTIYKSILARLQSEVPDIEWIDEDNGQLDQDRPPVMYPCCLIDLSYPSCESITDTEQEVTLNVGLRLAWDIKPSTASNAGDTIIDSGLSPYDLIDAVHTAIQGWAPEGCDDPLDRLSQKKTAIRAAFGYEMNYRGVAED